MKVTDLMRKTLPLKKCGAVIVAAGNASRMGGIDKVMAQLKGEPMIARTVRTFQNCDCIAEIVIVTRPDLILPITDLTREMPKVKAVVSGGSSRQESVNLGLGALSKEVKLAAIHDGARPLITMEVIDRYLDSGLDRVILGTAAVRDPDFLEEALAIWHRYQALAMMNDEAELEMDPEMQAELDEIFARPADEITEIAPYDNKEVVLNQLNGILQASEQYSGGFVYEDCDDDYGSNEVQHHLKSLDESFQRVALVFVSLAVRIQEYKEHGTADHDPDKDHIGNVDPMQKAYGVTCRPEGKVDEEIENGCGDEKQDAMP